MVDANHILGLLEKLSAPKDDEEILDTTVSFLLRWVNAGRQSYTQSFNQTAFLFFKRNIPKSLYTGKAYRLLWIDHAELMKWKESKGLNGEQPLTTKQLRSFLSSDKKYLSSITSWSKDLDGIEAAEKELTWRATPHNKQVLISDHITGFDIEEIYKFAYDLYSKVSKVTNVSYGDLQEIEGWALSQKEVVAPFNPMTFQIEN
jgi:hypothetical protein